MNAKGYDAALAKVRSLCLALPETKEVTAWGHPTFRAGKKMFAAFGRDADGPTLGRASGKPSPFSATCSRTSTSPRSRASR